MTLRLAALAAIFTLCICRISWPGFMSFDSMYALRQARTGIESATYPPMVSYLWWLCERFIRGQGGMFIVGNALAFTGVAALGRALGAGDLRILLAMLLLAAAPLTLGPMLVVWKDVAFGGLMAIAYAATLACLERKRPGTMVAALVSLAVASSFRLNGAAAAVPALAAIAWTVCGAVHSDGAAAVAGGAAGRILTRILVFSTLLAAVVGFVAITIMWRLPDLKRLDTPTGNVGVQLHDLLGISVCTGQNLVPQSIASGDMTLERLRRIYRPEHLGLSFGSSPLLDRSTVEANGRSIERAASAARIEHPWCYLEHRARVFLYSIGANEGPVFYLVHPAVQEGEAFTEMFPTKLTARAVGYITEHDASLYARGYLYAVLALVALLAARHGAYRPRMRKALLPVAGAAAYLIGSFFVVPAADARYNFWPNLVFMVTFCCVMPLPRIRVRLRTR